MILGFWNFLVCFLDVVAAGGLVLAEEDEGVEAWTKEGFLADALRVGLAAAASSLNLRRLAGVPAVAGDFAGVFFLALLLLGPIMATLARSRASAFSCLVNFFFLLAEAVRGGDAASLMSSSLSSLSTTSSTLRFLVARLGGIFVFVVEGFASVWTAFEVLCFQSYGLIGEVGLYCLSFVIVFVIGVSVFLLLTVF